MTVEYLKPSAAPKGTDRMMWRIRNLLGVPWNQSPDSTSPPPRFRVVSAFAKAGPLRRLSGDLTSWRYSGGKAEAVLGIDLNGTSQEALQLALQLFDATYVIYNPVPSCTFHPKFYLWDGPSRAVAIFGSHNMTVGGLETNYEAGILVEYGLPGEAQQWASAADCWNQLLPENCPNSKLLTLSLLDSLVDARLVLPEVEMGNLRQHPGLHSGPRSASTSQSLLALFPATRPVPPSAVPSSFVPRPRTRRVQPAAATGSSSIPGIASKTLVIQIIPHANGEIFLSATALQTNPAFFDYPFSGHTTSHRASNPPYPMRTPDPVVVLTLAGSSGSLSPLPPLQFLLNMVYYERKSEVRITIPPAVAHRIPPFSILVMEQVNPLSGYDYLLNVYEPSSQLYSQFLAVCTIPLPSGGNPNKRRMGWI